MSIIKDIKPVICIPVHKSDLSTYEVISIKRHLLTLCNYDRYLLVPESKSHQISLTLKIHNINDSEYKFHIVDDKFVKDFYSYNLFMLNLQFYNFYKSYSHILIAQMDAYTFSDQLLEWCSRDWDYVGARIYDFDNYWKSNILSCGLGGFSLRCLNTFIDVLDKNPIIFKYNDFKELSEDYNLKGKTYLFFKYLITNLLKANHLNHTSNGLLKYLGINEDLSFGKYLPKYLNSFKVADYIDSTKFCIDWNVAGQLNELQGNMPFGAHAWYSYPENLRAWKPYIEELN